MTYATVLITSTRRGKKAGELRQNRLEKSLAGDVTFGLASSIWTKDVGRAMRISKDLEFDAVWINDHMPLLRKLRTAASNNRDSAKTSPTNR